MALSFKDIHAAGRSFGCKGILKIATESISWKPKDGDTEDSRVEVSKDDISALTWATIGKSQQFRVHRFDGVEERFDGFARSDYDRVIEFCKQQMGLEVKDGLIAVDGGTSGNLQHDGSVLKLLNSFGKTVVDIPLQCVSSANLVDGREIVLEMHKYDESRTDECLMDIRFVLGTDEAALKQAKETHDSILELANLRQFTGELVTSLADIKMVVPGPRGKFSLDLYKNFFKIKDKSGEFDKNVSYDDISYMFMLNKVAAGGLQRTFVVGLDPPIRKGSSMYANLVFLMDEEERISLFIEMPESERKELGLPKNCAGFASDVVVEIFEKLTGPSGKKIHTCNENSTFRKAWAADHHAEQDVDCFKASISSDIGALYPLEKCLLFLEKPPTYIPIKDIASVSFKKPDVKIASSTSGFDLIVKRNNGQKTTFSQIAKSVQKPLMSWIVAKKISLEVLKETRPEKELSSDSEAASEGDDSDSDANAKGPSKAKAGAADAANDDSDSENDEDYKGDDKSSSGGSPSSSDSESDSGSGSGSGSGSDSDGEENAEPSPPRKAKRSKE